MILYRPVGLQELALIYDSGMKAFPARLPQQPIFYPVLDLTYARQTASDWNAQHGELAGYVTEFKVEDEYISQFEKHTVGGTQHQELWIPAEEMEEFNQNIIGHIKVLEAHFGEAFQGFVPEAFGLQGKNAVEQFTLLANSYLYKRMDFFLEIRRNHKAVFLNYPFWQTYEFKNPGLKEKIIKAIKEAWLTSFPQIPLPSPLPVHEDTPLANQTETHTQDLDDPVDEEITPEEQDVSDTQHLTNPVPEKKTPVKQTYADSLVEHPLREEITPEEQTDAQAHSWLNPDEEDITSEEQNDSPSLANPVDEDAAPVKQTDTQAPAKYVPAHFVQGIKLGLSGNYREAIDALSRAVEENPDDVLAHTSLGVAFHRSGEEKRALSSYEAALRIDPIYAEAHYFRANILYSQGNVREAIAGYTVAVGLKPELVEAHQKPGPEDRLTDYRPSPAEMRWIAKPAHRILELNKALETDPGQADLLKARAAEYYRLRNYVQAIADYSSFLTLQPDNAMAHHLRGLAYEQLGQRDRAREDYQQAIAINPQLADEYLNRGVRFGQMGQLRQSTDSLTEAIRLAPGSPNAYFNRGTVYFQQGDFERAIDDFSNVIRLSPEDEEAYYWRGISNEEAGRQTEAIADYRQFLTLSQDANARAEIEGKLSQWKEGKQDDQSSRSGVPDDRQKTDQVPASSGEPNQELDLYDLILALGKRALHSIWFASGVDCYGEKADELYALIEQDQPIDGRDLLSITSGIRQTLQGDFFAFDPGATSYWLFLRAWDGNGFYIEINDPDGKERLQAQFPSAEEVDGAVPPYEGLFIRL